MIYAVESIQNHYDLKPALDRYAAQGYRLHTCTIRPDGCFVLIFEQSNTTKITYHPAPLDFTSPK